MLVRQLKPNEVHVHESVRLTALSQSPRAFGDTLAAIQSKGDHYWKQLTERVCDVDAMLIAIEDERTVGMIYGLRDQYVRGGARLGGVWVEEQHRGRGAGRLLVKGALGWARSQGCIAVRLWVGEDEEPALALYKSCGFMLTRATLRFEHHPSRLLIEMHRTL